MDILKVIFDVVLVLLVSFIVFVIFLRIRWMKKIKKLKGQDLPILIGEFGRLKKGKGVIYFHSPQCRPCKMIEPIVKKLSKEYKKVHFIKVNVMEDLETAKKFGILATPTIIITREGKVEDVLIGPVPERVLREKLEV
ncbi:MAG: thioredoxin family protein [Desulfurobacteriaceae bacterium]